MVGGRVDKLLVQEWLNFLPSFGGEKTLDGFDGLISGTSPFSGAFCFCAGPQASAVGRVGVVLSCSGSHFCRAPDVPGGFVSWASINSIQRHSTSQPPCDR